MSYGKVVFNWNQLIPLHGNIIICLLQAAPVSTWTPSSLLFLLGTPPGQAQQETSICLLWCSHLHSYREKSFQEKNPERWVESYHQAFSRTWFLDMVQTHTTRDGCTSSTGSLSTTGPWVGDSVTGTRLCIVRCLTGSLALTHQKYPTCHHLRETQMSPLVMVLGCKSSFCLKDSFPQQ